MQRGINYLRRVAVLTAGQTLFTGGETALMDATRSGYADVVEVLLAHGAGLSLCNEAGHNAIDIARAACGASLSGVSPDAPAYVQEPRVSEATTMRRQRRHMAVLELLENEARVRA